MRVDWWGAGQDRGRRVRLGEAGWVRGIRERRLCRKGEATRLALGRTIVIEVKGLVRLVLLLVVRTW